MEIFNAIEYSDTVILEKLIKSGMDINVVDEFGQTPLHLAIDSAFEEVIHVFDTKIELLNLEWM